MGTSTRGNMAQHLPNILTKRCRPNFVILVTHSLLWQTSSKSIHGKNMEFLKHNLDWALKFKMAARGNCGICGGPTQLTFTSTCGGDFHHHHFEFKALNNRGI